ncbi:hypothetical protein [Haloglomus litoreum]|uniref:hypothetical protein n=1 Tax=Haloglomus litoreum TaxID=3034026 RepID=UPI0023E76036|nr:hypothetical protein [Haloglomus sp. DT116]
MSVSVGDRDVPLGVGAAVGAVAELVGYLLVFIITSGSIRDNVLRQATDIPTWKAVGWVFFNAHFVETMIDLGFLGSGTGSFIGEDGFSPILYAVPPLVLIAAGLAVGQYRDIDEPVEALLGAVPLTLGYLVLVLVDLFAFQADGTGPVFATGILLAGLVYPLVFGTVGGLVATVTD